MWLFFSLATVLLTTILALLFRGVSLKTKDQRAFAFVQNASVTLLLLIVLLYAGIGSIELSERTTVLVIASGVCYGAFQRYQFLVRKHIEASVLQTILTPTTIPAYILSIIWLNESVSFSQIAGYVILLIAIYLVTAQPGKKYPFNRYVAMALLIGSIMSIGTVLSKEVIPAFESILTYSFILWGIQTIYCYLPFVHMKSIARELKIHRWTLGLIAIISTLATGSILMALRYGSAAQVIPVTSSNVIFISIAGIIFLRERSRIGLKIFSAALAFVGLVLTSL